MIEVKHEESLELSKGTVLDAAHHGGEELPIGARFHDGLCEVRAHAVALSSLPHHVGLLHDHGRQPPLRLRIHLPQDNTKKSKIKIKSQPRKPDPGAEEAKKHYTDLETLENVFAMESGDHVASS